MLHCMYACAHIVFHLYMDMVGTSEKFYILKRRWRIYLNGCADHFTLCLGLLRTQYFYPCTGEKEFEKKFHLHHRCQIFSMAAQNILSERQICAHNCFVCLNMFGTCIAHFLITTFFCGQHTQGSMGCGLCPWAPMRWMGVVAHVGDVTKRNIHIILVPPHKGLHALSDLSMIGQKGVALQRCGGFL